MENREIARYCFVLRNPPDKKLKSIHILARSDEEADSIFERIMEDYNINPKELYANHLEYIHLQYNQREFENDT